MVLMAPGASAMIRCDLPDRVLLFTSAGDLERDLPLFPDLVHALEYWDAKRGSRAMPSRDDLDPAEMVEFLPRIMLADVEHQPLRFRYRLCGTGICRVHPGNATRLAADELQPPAYGALVHAQYQDVLQTGRPALHLNVFDDQNRYRSYAHLILPLSRGGTAIDMIMTVDSEAQDQAKIMHLLGQLQRRAGADFANFYIPPANRTT